MGLYPSALPSAGTANASATLAAAGHTSLHNVGADESRAIASKVGTGASTPTSAKLLRGNGVGTSAWAQADLTTDVTGTLPVANGGSGTTLLTFPSGADTLVARNTTDILTNKTLTTPTIASFVNANHDHSSSAQGGLLNASTAITDGTLTPAELTAGTGSSWSWQDWSPSYANITVNDGVVTAKYIQIGKTVFAIWNIVCGATTSIANGNTISLPVAAAAHFGSSNIVIGHVHARDVSASNTYMGQAITTNTTTVLARWILAGSEPQASTNFPVTEGTDDTFCYTLTYEAA